MRIFCENALRLINMYPPYPTFAMFFFPNQLQSVCKPFSFCDSLRSENHGRFSVLDVYIVIAFEHFPGALRH